MLSFAKIAVGLLALKASYCIGATVTCDAGLEPTPAPGLRCGVEGTLRHPGTPLTPSPSNDGSTPLLRCNSECVHTPSCISFAIDESTGACTLYDKRIIKMKNRPGATGVRFYNRRCFYPASTASGLANPGFEDSTTDFSPWQGLNGDVVLNTEDSAEGSQSVQMTSTHDDDPTYLYNYPLELCRGTAYRASLAYKVLDLGSCDRPGVVPYVIDQNGNGAAGTHDFTADEANVWTVLEFPDTFTPSTDPFQVVVEIGGTDSNEIFQGCSGLKLLVDDFKFTPVAPGSSTL